VGVGLHLRNHVLEEEEGAVVDAGKAGAEAAVVAFVSCSFLTYSSSDSHFTPKGDWPACNRTSCRGRRRRFCVAQGVAELDIVDLLALDEHVGTADGVGLGVVVLAEDDEFGVRVEFAEVLGGFREHSASAGRGIEEGADRAFSAEKVVIGRKMRSTIRRMTSRG